MGTVVTGGSPNVCMYSVIPRTTSTAAAGEFKLIPECIWEEEDDGDVVNCKLKNEKSTIVARRYRWCAPCSPMLVDDVYNAPSANDILHA
jgi:hypothetical protein